MVACRSPKPFMGVRVPQLLFEKERHYQVIDNAFLATSIYF